MATEYGYESAATGRIAWNLSLEACQSQVKTFGGKVVAREVSEPRIVSIRA